MLELKNVQCHYGRITAVNGVSLSVSKGELVSIIGANGAGKSTLFSTICGLLTTWDGEILFKGASLRGLPPSDIVSRGISMVPEGRQIFAPLSVMDNLLLGSYCVKQSRKARKREIARMMDLFPILGERRDQPAGTLSGGEQQMLAIGRALMAKPELLVLDEPSMGLAPKIVKTIFNTIRQLRSEGVTIVLVEQNAGAALAISDRGYVLETGKVVLEGSAKALFCDEGVKQAYIGKTPTAPPRDESLLIGA
ncbi:MAG: ABC transporter ATP-binding protein [Desulfobacterium sp.]|nr:ABC transporter ATP-binding protein [Desulfobacterium sp.]